MLDKFHKIPGRLIVYTRDVQNMTGLGPRAARKLIVRIKHSLNKSSDALLTIDEFCAITEIPKETAQEYMRH